jgi:hypothetical protein
MNELRILTEKEINHIFDKFNDIVFKTNFYFYFPIEKQLNKKVIQIGSFTVKQLPTKQQLNNIFNELKISFKETILKLSNNIDYVSVKSGEEYNIELFLTFDLEKLNYYSPKTYFIEEIKKLDNKQFPKNFFQYLENNLFDKCFFLLNIQKKDFFSIRNDVINLINSMEKFIQKEAIDIEYMLKNSNKIIQKKLSQIIL